MAKKARKKPQSRENGSSSPGLLRQVYPTIARWASGFGWVEFGIAEGLRRGQHFEITRLTSLKGLCKDTHAARSFAMSLAVHARRRAEEEEAPERFKELMTRAITGMESYLDDPTDERKERLHHL